MADLPFNEDFMKSLGEEQKKWLLSMLTEREERARRRAALPTLYALAHSMSKGYHTVAAHDGPFEDCHTDSCVQARATLAEHIGEMSREDARTSLMESISHRVGPGAYTRYAEGKMTEDEKELMAVHTQLANNKWLTPEQRALLTGDEQRVYIVFIGGTV